MCGIAGTIGPKISPEKRQACLGAMRHRGPDHSAAETWDLPSGRELLFLHSRLSIIDQNARANQPFHIGSKTLIYNGELYNYRELRAELEKEGISFSTQSDTEVLLQALDHWGWAALDRFEGMWAFAVYDTADGSLTFARDRFGEKPLYLYEEAGALFFGSETKCIRQLLGHPLKINQNHLMRYLINGYKALYKGTETFFEGLRELPAGHLYRIDIQGRAKQERYWSPRFQQNNEMGRGEAVAGVRERLFRAVEIRLRADVPLAFCMSGGVDSNSLISIAKKIHHFDVHGFTITNTDARYEENDMVETVIKELGIRHSSVPITTEHFLKNLRTLICHHDAPVYTISYYAHWMLMKKIAEQKYRISISGTGADELFTGYYDHHLAYIHDVQKDSVLAIQSKNNWERHVHPIVRNPFLQSSDAFIERPDMRDHIYLNSERFSSRLTHPWRETFQEQAYTAQLLRNRMLNEVFHETIPPILHEDDLNAMHFSIENRSPFLDRSLFEFANSIPTRHLIRNGYAKSILRDAMRGVVPDPVLDSHRKVGFNAPLFSFLDVSDPDVRAEVLADGPIYELVQKKMIAALLEESELPNSESKFLFSFLNAKYFMEAFS